MTTTLDTPPPLIDAERGGGGDWVQLVKAGNDIEAHLIVGRLSEAGVETRTVKDRSAPGAWLYGGSNPWAPVEILVQRVQFEDARIVMAEISLDAPPAFHVPPPSGPEVRARAVVWWVAAIALGIVFTSIALVRTGTALGSCGLPVICAEGTSSTP